jgi:hypothetical protein
MVDIFDTYEWEITSPGYTNPTVLENIVGRLTKQLEMTYKLNSRNTATNYGTRFSFVISETHRPDFSFALSTEVEKLGCTVCPMHADPTYLG